MRHYLVHVVPHLRYGKSAVKILSEKKNLKRQKEQDLKWWVDIGYERQCQINTCSDTKHINYLNFVFK